jgi:hypothetical protein
MVCRQVVWPAACVHPGGMDSTWLLWCSAGPALRIACTPPHLTPSLPPCPPAGDVIKGKVSRDDVAELCIALLGLPQATDTTFEIKSTVPFSTPWEVRTVCQQLPGVIPVPGGACVPCMHISQGH